MQNTGSAAEFCNHQHAMQGYVDSVLVLLATMQNSRNWELVLQSSCGQSHLMSVVMIFVHVKIGKLCLIQATCQVSRLHSDTNTKFKY